MHKKVIIWLTAVLAIISMVLLALPEHNETLPPSQPEQTNISNDTKQYRVKSHNGRIAVFIDGEDTPLYILNSPLVKDLPQYDRDLLTEGITAETNEKLLKILEDYDN